MSAKSLSRISGVALGAVVALLLAVGAMSPGLEALKFNQYGVHWYEGQEPSKISEPFNQPTWDRAESNPGNVAR